jgi:hypothetical protein
MEEKMKTQKTKKVAGKKATKKKTATKADKNKKKKL